MGKPAPYAQQAREAERDTGDENTGLGSLLDIPVPTSGNQRETQVLTSRTSVDSAAPTIVDVGPPTSRDERSTRREEAAPSKRTRPRNPVTARLRARVLELTAEMKAPDARKPGERNEDPLQVTTVDQLAALEHLDKTTELDLGQTVEVKAVHTAPAMREPADLLDEQEQPAQDKAPPPAEEEPPTVGQNIEQIDPEAEEQQQQAPADEDPTVTDDPPLTEAEEAPAETTSPGGHEDPELDPVSPTDPPPRDPRDTFPPGNVAQPAQYYPLSRRKDTLPPGQEAVKQALQEEAWIPADATPPVLFEGARHENGQTQPFQSKWAHSGGEGDMMAAPGGHGPHPAHQRGMDQDLTNAGLLGGPQRVEIRQVRSDRPHPRLVMLTSPGSAMAEQYRVLSLKLKENVHVRTIGVMSPTAEEESELVGANLALALAEGNRSRVCLVDGDMRQSKMARLLGLREGPTLARQVRLHRRDPEAPWVVLGMETAFHVIPGDRDDPNPAELLNSEALFDLMDELRREFDYIVITPPPLLESADGAILQEHTDGVILSAKTRVTRQDSMKSCLKHLTDGKVLGTVLLDAPKKARG